MRFGVTEERTRIVLDLDSPGLKYRMAADGDTAITFLLPDLHLTEGVPREFAARGRMAGAWLSERADSGASLVIRFRERCSTKVFGLDAAGDKPNRLVIDLRAPKRPSAPQSPLVSKPKFGGPSHAERQPASPPKEKAPAKAAQPPAATQKAQAPPVELPEAGAKVPPRAISPPETAPPKAPPPESRPGTTPPAATDLTPSPKRVGPRIVVIDAGHGGDDPGAIGPGLREKDVCLDVARRLHKLLAGKRNLKAYLTRDRDVLIPLRKRMEMAEALGADLFVSIHVNASDSHNASGAEVFFLSVGAASDEASSELARLENNVDPASARLNEEGLREIPFTVSLRQSDTLLRSSRACEVILDVFAERHLARSRGVRQAGFAVLKSFEVPSILVELGFISSPDDRKALKSASHRQKLAEALADGIVEYFQKFAPVKG